VVSPLLSNILLTPFDREMRRKGYQLTRYADDWVLTCESAAEARAAVAAALRILNELGVQLQESPRPKALPPARRLDCAAHSVAAIQAVAERRLATVAGNQVVRRVRAGELDSVDPFDCISEAEVFVKAVCGKTARTV
jgi:hypothetical protein